MKKREGLTINIHLTNRWLYTLIAVGILAAIGAGVYAYGTNAPSTFGHSVGELDLSGGITTTSINVSSICIAGDCKTSWPVPVITYLPSDQLIVSANTQKQSSSTSYVKFKEIQLGAPGTFAVKSTFQPLNGMVNVCARIYKNGVAAGIEHCQYQLGTVSDNITANKNDLIQLYVRVTNTGYPIQVSAFGVYGSITDPFIVTQN